MLSHHKQIFFFNQMWKKYIRAGNVHGGQASINTLEKIMGKF